MAFWLNLFGLTLHGRGRAKRKPELLLLLRTLETFSVSYLRTSLERESEPPGSEVDLKEEKKIDISI